MTLYRQMYNSNAICCVPLTNVHIYNFLNLLYLSVWNTISLTAQVSSTYERFTYLSSSQNKMPSEWFNIAAAPHHIPQHLLLHYNPLLLRHLKEVGSSFIQ